MTKEEIILKHDPDYTLEPHRMLLAMDEYAKQEAIGFFDWFQKNDAVVYNDNRELSNNYTEEVYTTEQLYNLYKEVKQ